MSCEFLKNTSTSDSVACQGNSTTVHLCFHVLDRKRGAWMVAATILSTADQVGVPKVLAKCELLAQASPRPHRASGFGGHNAAVPAPDEPNRELRLIRYWVSVFTQLLGTVSRSASSTDRETLRTEPPRVHTKSVLICIEGFSAASERRRL